MGNLHPLFTHFPVALLTVGYFFDVAGVLNRNHVFERIGWWLQLVGTITLGLTVITGLMAKSTVNILPDARTTFEWHEQIAFAVCVVAAATLYWRTLSKSILPSQYRIAYFSIQLLMVVLIWIGAWHGGELVYRFSVGVQELSR